MASVVPLSRLRRALIALCPSLPFHKFSQFTPTRSAASRSRLPLRMPAAIPRDVREFLDDYPDNTDDRSRSDNLLFYSNKRRCRPDNLYIDDLHKQ